jgi:hypothetical protein
MNRQQQEYYQNTTPQQYPFQNNASYNPSKILDQNYIKSINNNEKNEIHMPYAQLVQYPPYSSLPVPQYAPQTESYVQYEQGQYPRQYLLVQPGQYEEKCNHIPPMDIESIMMDRDALRMERDALVLRIQIQQREKIQGQEQIQLIIQQQAQRIQEILQRAEQRENQLLREILELKEKIEETK